MFRSAFALLALTLGCSPTHPTTPLVPPLALPTAGLSPAAFAAVEAAEYTLDARDGEIHGYHRGHAMRVRADRGGLSFSTEWGAGAGSWFGLRLVSAGREGQWSLGGSPEPRLGPCLEGAGASLDGDCQRVAEFDHGGVLHHLANRRSGVEHLVVVPPDVRAEGEGPLRVRWAVLDASFVADNDGAGGRFDLPSGGRFRYEGLHAFDARGQTLPATLEPWEGGFDFVVDDALAEGEVVIDPVITPEDWSFSGGWTGEAAGTAVAAAGDLDGDGYGDLAVGAPTYNGSGADAGRVFVFFGSENGPSASPDLTFEGTTAGDRLGAAIAPLGDIDADGDWDLAIAAPGLDVSQMDAGGVYVLEGSSSGPYSLGTATVLGSTGGAQLGAALAGPGDVNGDGFADLLVGAPTYSNGISEGGQARIHLGSGLGLASTAAWVQVGTAIGDKLGSAVSGAGDWNGDGYQDFVVGTPFADGGGTDAGRVSLFLGGAGSPAVAPWFSHNGSAGDQLGYAVARLGDVQRDGYGDFAAGAPLHESTAPLSAEGQVLVWYGQGTGTPSQPSFSAGGGTAGAHFGAAVAGAGDVDGDGYADLAVGAPDIATLGPSTGRVTLYPGSAQALVAASFQQLDGPTAGGEFGSALATAGDVDGDGLSDLLIGEPGNDSPTLNVGRARLHFGTRSTFYAGISVQFGGPTVGAAAGTAVAGLGDVNGDGFGDLGFGLPGYDQPFVNAGAVFVYYGGATQPQTTPSWSLLGVDAERALGGTVSSIGDVDFDGYGDILIGGPDSNEGGADSGGYVVVPGGPTGLAVSPTVTVSGAEAGGRLGSSAASLGDLNGDGFLDFAVGAEGEGTGGRVYALLTDPVGPPAPTMLSGVGSNAEFGASVAAAGDLNGDGFADLAVGAPANNGGAGSVQVFAGAATGLATVPVWTANGPVGSTLFGTSIAGVGDVTGDGDVDLLVGAPGYDDTFTNRGRIEVFAGVSAGWPATIPMWTQLGPAAGHLHGSSVLALGDIDLDGMSDFAAGSPGAASPSANAGRVDVYLGGSPTPPAAGIAVLGGTQGGEALGSSLGAADFNGDGLLDLIAGAPGWDNGLTADTGRAALFMANTGLHALPSQGLAAYPRESASSTPIQPWAGISDTAYALAAVLRGPEGRARLRLVVEDAPSTGTFDGLGVDQGSWADTGLTGSPTLVGVETSTSLSARQFRYRWEADPSQAPLVIHSTWLPGNPSGAPGTTDLRTGTSSSADSDGDTFADSIDCGPTASTIYPGAPELCNGMDDDCDSLVPTTEADADGDLVRVCDGDCADTVATQYPGAPEVCNGGDEDCDGVVPSSEFDGDGDGFSPCVGDCNDFVDTAYPGAVEVCDALDTNCDFILPPTEVDFDGDAWAACLECDDSLATVYPGAPELCDGADTDCSGSSVGESDADFDGFAPCAGDCDDTQADIRPGVPDVCDGFDTNCDGNLPPGDLDVDGDDHFACTDCDDGNFEVHPTAPEICDGLDSDCDGGVPPVELDGDGDGEAACSGDCDDSDPLVLPGAEEVCDGADEDCDGAPDTALVDGMLYPNVPLSDAATTTQQVVLVGALPIADLDVYLHIQHTRTGDLDVELVAPDGTIVPLTSDNGAGGDHYFETIFDDEAAIGITTAAAPFTGSFVPESPLSAVDRIPLTGTWTLRVTDDLAGHTGTLLAWGFSAALAGALDADGDGMSGCGDCDDTDAARAPNLTEICDGLDNNCDGNLSTDELDADGDGFSFCDGDCDDTNPAFSPDGVDVPGDLLDQDCSGGDASPGGMCWIDGDLDGSGSTAQVVSIDADCLDAGEAAASGDCDDAEPQRAPTLPEVCDGLDNDCLATTVDDEDGDGDGHNLCEGDCDDTNTSIGAGFPELCDGFDNDCLPGGDELVDQDGDLYSACDGDCDDSNAFVAPGLTELCDSVDTDCDGSLGAVEVDGDGDAVAGCDGDCDDADPSRFPSAVELCNGVDDDCTGFPLTDEFDPDGDGALACAGDCAPFDPLRGPTSAEACDGFDGNCDGAVPPAELDGDGDNVAPCEGDCDDGEAATFPGAPEPPAGPDRNCDGIVGDIDADGDGVTTSEGDCDDGDAEVRPGIEEGCDGIDGNCDGLFLAGELDDLDADGFFACQDCQPLDAAIHPGAAEICDGLDDDCDGYDLETGETDVDRDGAFGCQGDCDDDEPAVREGLPEDCDDGLDNDCDGTVDVNTDADHDDVGSCEGDCRDNNADISPLELELCNGIDEDCDGAIDDGFDADGDGFSPCAGDCDDTEPDAYLGAPAICNDDLDNDCVPTTQEDVDSDGDGAAACSEPGDCWEGNPHVFPGGEEVCDLSDNDCDGEVDEGLDEDGDGWARCRFDCDDGDPLAFPGAEEICDEGDENCDGEFDENCEAGGDDDSAAPAPDGGCNCEGSMVGSAQAGFALSVALMALARRARRRSAFLSWLVILGCGLAAEDGDGFGTQASLERQAVVAAQPSVTALGNERLATLAANERAWSEGGDTFVSSHRGLRLEARVGPEGLRAGRLADAGIEVTLAAVGRAGVFAPAELGPPRFGPCVSDGDLLADGGCERFVERQGPLGSERWASRPEGWEHSFIIETSGGAGPLELQLRSDGHWLADGASATIEKDDLRLSYGAPRAWDAHGRELPASLHVADHGAIVRVDDRGAVSPIHVDPLLTLAPASIDGDEAGLSLGATVVGLGDLNGDGFGDVALGAPSANSGGMNRGRVDVHLGSATGLQSPAHRSFLGPAASDRFGSAVAAVGDLDGDGLADLAIGAPGHDGGASEGGGVWVWFGSSAGLSATADWSSLGLEVDGEAGAAVAGGDLNGDGLAELIVGLPGHALAQGQVDLFSGVAAGAPANVVDSRVGGLAGSRFGATLAFVGDTNDDALGDVLVGAPGTTNPTVAEGAAWLLGGALGLSGEPAFLVGNLWNAEGGAAAAQLGASLAWAGDCNGDGASDFLVGAPGLGSGGEASLYLGASGGPATFPSWTASGAAGEGFGSAVSSAGDINGDGRTDILVGAPEADSAGMDHGTFSLYLGAVGGALATAQTTWTGPQSGSRAGAALGFADVDGDGYSDALVGLPGYDTPSLDAGRVHVFPGSPSLPATVADATRVGGQSLANLGHALSFVGDVNADGFDDAVLGAWHYSQGQTNEGGAFLYLGDRGGLSANAAYSAQGDQSNAFFGAAVAGAGDVNADGYADVVIGAYGAESGAALSNEGETRLYLGAPAGLTTTFWTQRGGVANANFGYSLASAGDVNADGYADILVGGRQWPGAGGTGVQRGGVTLWLGTPFGLGGGYSWGTEGVQDYDQLGTAVAGLGDVNGDGFADIVVGAPHPSTNLADEGYVRVFHGFAGGLQPNPARELSGLGIGDQFGAALAGGLDVDGDGFADLVVGAPDAGAGDVGEVQVFSGSPSGIGVAAVTISGPSGATEFGGALGNAGDLDNNGRSDLIVGDPGFSGGASGEGWAGLYLGTDAGLLGAPSWSVEGDQAGAGFGFSVAGGGDIDGDGFPELLAGAWQYDGTLSGEGQVRLYRGNGGDLVGPPVAGSATLWEGAQRVQPFGRVGGGAVEVHLDAVPLAGSLGRQRVTVEAAPLGVAFAGGSAVSGGPWMPAVAAGQTLTQSVALPSFDTPFHLRARPEPDPALGGGWHAGPWRSGAAAWEPQGLHLRSACDFDFDGDGSCDALDFNDDNDASPDAVDCETQDNTIFPGAPEVVGDGIDQDCNGGDTVVCWDDHDEDGFGGGISYEDADGCVASDQATGGGDCDDGREAVFSGAAELCDGLDTDCFDGPGDGTGGTPDERDLDGDAYLLCTEFVEDGAPGVDGGADCDDAVASVNPAAFELTNDCIDTDCVNGPAPVELADTDFDLQPGCDDCDDTDPLVRGDFAELCDGIDNDCDLGVPTNEADGDGDGWVPCGGDCDDSGADRFPGAPEAIDSGADLNCDGVFGGDRDGDGQNVPEDCDDANGARGSGPSFPEICDGVDNDCDGQGLDGEGFDGDGDGWLGCDDCNDSDAAIFPGAEERCDLRDSDCDGLLGGEEGDLDDDGVPTCAGDCDPENAEVYPGRAEDCSDGLDNDCVGGVDGLDDPDADGDGEGACDGDCDDGDDRISSQANDLCDGLDNNCDGEVDELFDNDRDGFSDDCGTPEDCDDADPETYPGAPPVCDDHADNDCDPATDEWLDADGDGFAACPDGDCDDRDAGVYPEALEQCDGLDDDCDGVADDGLDLDGDGRLPCTGDCGEDDERVRIGLEEDCADALDTNCDGRVDEDCAVEPADLDLYVPLGCGCGAAGNGAGASALSLAALFGLLLRRRWPRGA